MSWPRVTKPGTYDLPEADYHADPVPEGSLSCSGAKLLLPPSCPARYDWVRKHPPEPTLAMEFGTAAHREVLGTGWAYAVGDPAWTDWTTKASQEWRKEQRKAGVTPLLGHEREKVLAMAAAIRLHPTAQLLLQADEVWPEKSYFWRDEEWGIWRRSRRDAVRLHDRVYIADYKTAKSADPEQFAKACANYSYFMQAAWYPEAITCTLGDADPAFLFVVQEKDPPYLAAIYELDGEAILLGREHIGRACMRFADCQESGVWPGYQPDAEIVTKISLPRWAF